LKYILNSSEEEEHARLQDDDDEYDRSEDVHEDGQDEDTQSEAGSDRTTPCLCHKCVLTLEVGGDTLSGLHSLYVWGSIITLVLSETVGIAGLQLIRQPRHLVRGFEGKLTTIDCCFYLSVLDTDGNIQVILADGVDGIVTMARSRKPQDAGDVFPVIQSSLE
jgi:hypothetical protein